jgi:hypothetical protein
VRTTSAHFSAAKRELSDQLHELPLTTDQRTLLSKRIAKFTAQAVREDRVHRMPYDSLAKICDVVINGRPA